jgi:hypothetical protein
MAAARAEAETGATTRAAETRKGKQRVMLALTAEEIAVPFLREYDSMAKETVMVLLAGN